MSEAWLALPLSLDDGPSRAAAAWLAAALDGADGILAQALTAASADSSDPSRAPSGSAMLVGGTRSPALVVRVAADDDRLDAAVAQVRAVLQRLQRDGLRSDDLTRAAASIASRRLAASLDPRTRAIALWRGEAEPPAPSVEALRVFASAALHDDALVVVAARPRRPDPAASKR
jgi:hypothetical protein